uniref:Defensin n=1 Tax=Perna viridis TaxID=73031 RepID=A0A2S1PVL7_PERVI|nr:defensin [Perna viridis]
MLKLILVACLVLTLSGSEAAPQRRATCDLFSIFGVGDSACAAHCLVLGHRGGYCNSQSVCICRD